MNRNFGVLERLKRAWNVFTADSLETDYQAGGIVSSYPSHRVRRVQFSDKSIVGAMYNRIAVDVAMLEIRHARADVNERYVETIPSALNRCLTLEANIDQGSHAFLQDVARSLFDEGVVAIVPVDVNVDLRNNNSFDVLSMRTGRIIQWYPTHVRVRVYNDRRGETQDVTLPKNKVAIVENPLYEIMNEPSSILQRLIRKLNLIDAIDEQSGSGKLDLIIQLPYTVKSQIRKEQAEARRKDLENQLKDSKYGVAYADGTEKVIQLNRPAENNLMAQVEYLTRMLNSQLGISEAILNGTANESELLTYQNRTVNPIVTAIAQEMTRKFITQTAYTQGQRIMVFRDLFAIVTPERLADLADKLTRNEIASPNDLRAAIGWKPSKDQSADELRNRNINQSVDEQEAEPSPSMETGE